jgi:hypothetical protein
MSSSAKKMFLPLTSLKGILEIYRHSKSTVICKAKRALRIEAHKATRTSAALLLRHPVDGAGLSGNGGPDHQ